MPDPDRPAAVAGRRPVDVMVDGEVLTLHCEELDVLPGALNVVA